LTDALAQATISRSRSDQPADEQRWVEQTETLQRLGRQIRSAVYDLSLDSHEDHAFADLLGALIAIQDGLAADCRVELRGRDHLPAGPLGHRGTQVLRIVREAVTNARRHAGATAIRVDAGASTPQFLQLDIDDNGQWRDRKASVTGGSGTGIPSMLERADRLHATLRINRRPDGGTRASLRLPLTDPSPG
jgi:signal transduction histidine kinase